MNIVQIDAEFFKHDAQAGGFFPNTHTNLILDIEKFITPTGQNYIVEGIRGTGKTHILKMINNRCLEKYDKLKILPVYISLAGVSEWIERDMVSFRLHLYNNIVKSTIDTVKKNRSSIELSGNKDLVKSIKKIGQMFGFNKEENFDELLEEIRNLSETLTKNLTYSLKEQLIKELREETDIIEGTMQSSVVNVKGSVQAKNGLNTELKFLGSNLAHEDAATFILEFFRELRNILGNSYSYILIDECSEVSKEAQIEVFRLLKLVRGSGGEDIEINPVYFCATAYPTPITYYPSKTKGDSFNFEMGHDAVVEYLDLDELDDEYLDFFKEMTNKRLNEFKKEDTASSYMEIFENERVFVLSAYLANGNIRRYIEILKHSYDNLAKRVKIDDTSSKQAISQKDVQEAVYSIVNDQILSFNRLNEQDMELLHDIISKLSKRNKKTETENKSKINKIPANVYFTISRLQANTYGNLIMQGALHDKGRTRRRKYYTEGGVRGLLYMLDLSVAFNESAIDRQRAVEIFSKDLKANAKSGYLYCQDVEIK
ncbi:hypothetical protein psyc5s11_29110 [Clostridium gelidum]|uniref:Uncharacterized protein n=1 Tax=Clostridium gelidum TaxID=704125 RepID=A0ABM7TD07_9CLOT|nr:hypothetical protein [Clostridium gelidum]BCZ46844.1 hypothetical protein psyc5s11_29110 [Clostridium gelidum]